MKKQRYSQLSKSIFNKYILSVFTLALVLLGGFFLSWFICSQFVWQPYDQLYELLKMLQVLSPVIIAITLFAGFFILTYIAIKKPMKYLDNVINAAKSLAKPTDIPIELPEEMTDIQNELNLAREQALSNIRLLRETEQRKNDLIMYLAHDLKTPLASVIGYLNLLNDESEIPAPLREKYLSIALSKSERLEYLINEFFEISRFNLSNITLQYSKINLTLLLDQLIYEFKPILKEKNLTCCLNAENNIMLNCDADKIQRVFDNLLRNAVIYSFSDSEIEITVTVNNNNIIIKFINHGNTIPGDKINRIFEQFYRLDTSRSTSGGAGLGLAIAKQIVELHNGIITAKSYDELIIFTVTLPLS